MHIKIMISSSLRCRVLISHKIQCIDFNEIVNVSKAVATFTSAKWDLSTLFLWFFFNVIVVLFSRKECICTSGNPCSISIKPSFIPVSGLCGRFWQVELICMINANDSGTKFTSPEFRLPFAQTVNRTVCQCCVNGKQAIFTRGPSLFCLTVL